MTTGNWIEKRGWVILHLKVSCTENVILVNNCCQNKKFFNTFMKMKQKKKIKIELYIVKITKIFKVVHSVWKLSIGEKVYRNHVFHTKCEKSFEWSINQLLYNFEGLKRLLLRSWSSSLKYTIIFFPKKKNSKCFERYFQSPWNTKNTGWFS